MKYDKAELAIIVDGKFVQVKGKLVYVKLQTNKTTRNTELFFFCKSTNVEATNEALPTMENTIVSMLTTNAIGDVKIPEHSDPDKCKLKISGTLGLLVLESELYNSVRQVVEKAESGFTIRFSGRTLDLPTISALMMEFRNKAFINYQNTVYSYSHNRFINRLMRANKFYGIQTAFVPVFVRCSLLYDPFCKYKDSLDKIPLYKAAVNAGRKIQLDNAEDLSCYLLTHLEICRALKMRHLMRFTPAFLYRILVGQIEPALQAFPNKNTEIMIRPQDCKTTYVQQAKFTIPEFKKKYEDTQRLIDECTDPAELERLNEMLTELKSYTASSSLYYEIARNWTKLTNIGSYCLDSRDEVSIAKLYEYLSEV